MGAIAFQTTRLAIVYSTVYSRRRWNKTSKLRVPGLCEGNSPVTGEFPAQRASNAENVPIWWRHHGLYSLKRIHLCKDQHMIVMMWLIIRIPTKCEKSQADNPPNTAAMRYCMRTTRDHSCGPIKTHLATSYGISRIHTDIFAFSSQKLK